MRQHKQLNAKTLWGGVILWPLFLLAVTPLVLTAPVHATDNTVELTIGSDADLKPSAEDATLYKATTSVKVKTTKPYGFNVTIHADSANLVNTKDNNHQIEGMYKGPEGMLLGMNTNSWGYRVDEAYNAIMEHAQNKFLRTPAGDETPNVVIDTASKRDNAGCKRKDKCEVHVTFGAAIAPNSLAAGKYSTTVTYTATAKPKPAPMPKPIVESTICKSGDPHNDCQVDIDANMIPVKYTGSTTHAEWTSLAKPEDSSNQGNWYNYNNKQWANAVTVKDPSKYKNQTRVVDQSDILGYWVYIPRYAYEVMRRDGTDNPVSAQNFLISFEKTTTPKRRPAACPEQGKDYREDCDLDRSYIKGKPSNQGTWATHPDFTFGAKELNGIWFAKFETTGSTSNPTVLPGQSHIDDNNIGIYYSVAKSIGVHDPQNVGGNSVSTTQNNHHLAKLISHMVNNNDWGATTYLSASKYGAGYNGVHINPTNDNTGYNYNTNDGQLTSTTNNPTGIYDMSGGGWEYTAASYGSDLSNSSTSNFDSAAHPPYVNTYNITNMNSCTFVTCGGQALYETNDGVGTDTGNHMWNSQHMYFRPASDPWFYRGGSYNGGSDAGLFYAGDSNGFGISLHAFRVALTPAPHD